MTVLPMKALMDFVIAEEWQHYLFLCAELRAIGREIEEFKAEVTQIKKNVGLTHNGKILPFPKVNVSRD